MGGDGAKINTLERAEREARKMVTGKNWQLRKITDLHGECSLSASQALHTLLLFHYNVFATYHHRNDDVCAMCALLPTTFGAATRMYVMNFC